MHARHTYLGQVFHVSGLDVHDVERLLSDV